MKFLKNKSFIVLIIMIISVLYSMFTQPKLIFVCVFSLFYLLLAYFLFNETERKFTYFCAFMFSIIALGNRHHYYIAFAIYILILIRDILKAKKDGKSIFQNFSLNKYSIFLIVFVLYMFLSLAWAFNRNMGIKYIAKYIISLTMMLMFIIENKTKDELKETIKFFNYLFLGVLLLGLLEILGFDFGLQNHFYDLGIINRFVDIIPVTFFYNPNNYAVFLVMGLITNSINLIYNKKDKYYYLSFVSFILTIINLIFTRSRTALIVTIFTFLFIAVLGLINYKNKEFLKNALKYSLKCSIITFVIFFIISIFPSMSYYCGKFAKMPILREIQRIIFAKGGSSLSSQNAPVVIGASGSDNVRVTIIYDVLKGVFINKHIFGFGVGNAGKWLMMQGNTHGIFAVHSYWFEILADFGIFMLLYVIYIFANIFFKMFFKFFKKDNKDRYALVGICLLVAWSMLVFGPSSIITFTPFWISMGLIYSIFRQYYLANN